MKKRFLGVAMALAMLLTLIPFAPGAQAASFEATLMGQVDTDVSDVVPEWGFGDIPEATVSFDLRQAATIKMEFDEPIKFTGNWTGISTNVPVDDDMDAQRIGAIITSFKVDGEDLGSRVVPIIDRDGNGFLCIDIARQWGGDYDPYGLQELDPYQTLEITFVVGYHKATLMGQLDTSVSDSIGEWSFGDLEDASVLFEIGKEATIKMSFDEAIKFTGNWTGIATSIPVDDDEGAEATGAIITSFKVDGNDLGSKEVPLINRDNSGFMTIDIARQWGGDYDEYDLAGMDPFKELEITFIVPNMPDGSSGGDSEPVDFAKEGNAWIGGTFIDDEGEFDWIEYQDQSVAFKLGVPFTVVLDFGSDKQTHGEAGWGYISVVQTDIQDSASNYDVYINDIRVDGHSISFEPGNVSVGFDRGVRFGLTDGWAANPVVSGPPAIGEFSKLEVEVAFVAAGDPSPFGADTSTPEPNVPPPPPIERPPTVDDAPKSEGMQWWVWLIIGGAVVVVGAVVAVVVMKKKA